MTDDTRPLSPHLQVYKPQLTSMLTIFSRGFSSCIKASGCV